MKDMRRVVEELDWSRLDKMNLDVDLYHEEDELV